MNALCFDIPEMPLFKPVAKRNDPLSSYVAGEKAVRSKKCKEEREQIYRCLQLHGAMNNRQISDITGIDYHEVARRMHEIAGLNKIERNGQVTLWEAK